MLSRIILFCYKAIRIKQKMGNIQDGPARKANADEIRYFWHLDKKKP